MPGNTTTLAHYLDLLGGAGMLTGLQKYAGQAVRQRGSSPKLQVLNTALMTAQCRTLPDEARADREFRGRLVESAVGAHLANAAAAATCELFYWRERNREVDFVVRAGRAVRGHRGEERTRPGPRCLVSTRSRWRSSRDARCSSVATASRSTSSWQRQSNTG